MTTQLHPLLKPGYVGKLKNRLPYRCYATDGIKLYPIHGAYEDSDGWNPILHRDNGICYSSFSEHDIALPSVALPEYEQPGWRTRGSEEVAIRAAMKGDK